GSPQTHSSSRSSRSWRSVTARSAAASSTVIPGRVSRYGMRLSSLPTRSVEFTSATLWRISRDQLPHRRMRRGDLAEPVDHVGAYLGRVENHDVGAIPDEPGREP